MTDWTDEQIEALCQAATPGPWKLSEPQGNWIWPHICNTYGSRREDAQFIAAARELVSALYARARKAEAERDRQRARADHNANAVNENADMIVRLRAELAEAKAEAVERLRQFNAAKDQRDAALADADRLRAELAEAKAENERLSDLVADAVLPLIADAIDRGVEPKALGDYSDEQIELMVARLGTDEYNQGVPRCAPWWTSPSCSGPDRWIVYQPTGSFQSRIIAEGVRQPFADFIAAARELVPSLLARAQQAEADRDAALGKVSAIDGGFDVYRRQMERMESRLRAEADELRRQLLDETYRPEGGEIVMRELIEAKAALHAALVRETTLAAQVAAVRAAAEKAAKALQWLPSQYTVGEENSLRVVSLLHEDVYRIGSELRAALDGTGQDEAAR